MKSITRSTFLKRVHDTIKHYDMLKKGDKVLVAVSGGPDSVCLLDALLNLKKKLGIELVVANMDHGIRGIESRGDSDFVRDLAKKTNLKFIHKRIALKGTKRSKLSLEERAREKRYTFLKDAAKKNSCNIIATGHTLDDQAETVLMRIISGTSFFSIAGIPPARNDGKVKIIRPLIRTSKDDILKYLKKEKLTFVKDKTNRDTNILRNAVRLKMIPFLEGYNPRLKRVLVNFADTAREDAAFLNELKREAKGSLTAKKGKGEVSIKLADLVIQPRALRKEVFKEAIDRSGGNIKKLTHRHWMEADYLLRKGTSGKSLDFPGDIRVTRYKDKIVFKKRQT